MASLFRRGGAELATVIQSAADPAAITGVAQLYSKAVAGAAELFMRSGLAAGTISQVAGLAAPLTAGSIPFANVSGQLAQDNANLFYDDTSNILGVGTNAPGLFTDTKLEVFRVGHCVSSVITVTPASDAIFILGTFTAPNDMAMFLDESDSQKLKFALGDVNTDALRNTNTKMALTQTGLLGVGTSSPLYTLDVRNAGPSQIHIAGGAVDSGGYLTSTVAAQLYLSGGIAFNGVSLIAKATTASVVEMNTGAISFQTATGLTIGAASAMTERMLLHNAGGLELLNSDAATAALASRGKFRYTTVGQKMQLSHSTGGYFDIATYAAALTAGSIVFANGSNQLAQDNANFFWDDTNNRLGIGNAAPTTALDVTGTTRTTNATITAMATGSVLFAGASGAVAQDNANLFWDDTNNRLGVNDNTPSEAIDVTGSINMTVSLFRGNTKVVGAQGAAVADASGGVVIDIEARAQLNELLSRLRASTGHGLIA